MQHSLTYYYQRVGPWTPFREYKKWGGGAGGHKICNAVSTFGVLPMPFLLSSTKKIDEWCAHRHSTERSCSLKSYCVNQDQSKAEVGNVLPLGFSRGVCQNTCSDLISGWGGCNDTLPRKCLKGSGTSRLPFGCSWKGQLDKPTAAISSAPLNHDLLIVQLQQLPYTLINTAWKCPQVLRNVPRSLVRPWRTF